MNLVRLILHEQSLIRDCQRNILNRYDVFFCAGLLNVDFRNGRKMNIQFKIRIIDIHARIVLYIFIQSLHSGHARLLQSDTCANTGDIRNAISVPTIIRNESIQFCVNTGNISQHLLRIPAAVQTGFRQEQAEIGETCRSRISRNRQLNVSPAKTTIVVRQNGCYFHLITGKKITLCHRLTVIQMNNTTLNTGNRRISVRSGNVYNHRIRILHGRNRIRVSRNGHILKTSKAI